MNSRLYVGALEHERYTPVRHAFRYPVYLYGFDLDELPELARRIPFFGHDRIRPVSLHERDYLDGGTAPLRERLEAFLAPRGVTTKGARVELVTAARFFGHVFNPVSFYRIVADDGLRAVVAEVNNTFGQRHLYVLDDLRAESGGHASVAARAKAFHVSPFEDMHSDYAFRFGDASGRLDVTIAVSREGRPAFRAHLTGEARPLDTRELLRVIARQPLDAVLTFPRIVAQAAVLRWRHGLKWHAVPRPTSGLTIRRGTPGPVERVAERLVLGALDRVRETRLELTTPAGRTHALGRADAARSARLEVHEPAFYTRLARRGDIGLGESYERGEWSTPDLPGLLERLGHERAAFERGASPLDVITRPLERVRHALRANTPRTSRRNIADHYDLGNAFFALFLDPSMTYSSARFAAPARNDEPLEDAQERKLARALDLAQVRPGARMLEIGCGWGSFSRLAAARAGASVHGLTLSREQLAWAGARAREAGLESRLTYEYRDWRAMDGRFDAIVSIEMIEAVGRRNLGRFFHACDAMLAPGGRLVLQAITIADAREAAYRARPDWIQRYIFPGGYVPTISGLADAARRNSAFTITRLESFGADYARTLGLWRARLAARQAEARALGLPESFLRRWDYYFAYCEAGFRLGEINVVQMVLERPAALAGRA